MVVVHSESVLIPLSLLVSIAVVLSLLVSAALTMGRNFRLAKRLAWTTLSCWAGWVVVANLISLLTPQTIVEVGETYCMDINCLGIDAVITQAHASNTTYKLNAHVFNDANTVKISFKNVAPYVVDESGRRFPLVNDPTATRYDALLDPGQSIKTTLAFDVASDARQLFLTLEETGPQEHIGGKTPPLWLKPVLPIVALALYGGGGFVFQKQAVWRVL